MKEAKTINEDKAVAWLSERLALKCGCCPEEARHIKAAAKLHDAGKAFMPPDILHKPDMLLPHEFEQMKLHTIYGARILLDIQGEAGRFAATAALLHHEWYNGQGYWGFKASTLPGYIGIVAVCDVYVALVSQRAYKKAWPHYEALRYIEQQAGSQFCPKLALDFVSMADGLKIKNDGLLTNICI